MISKVDYSETLMINNLLKKILANKRTMDRLFAKLSMYVLQCWKKYNFVIIDLGQELKLWIEEVVEQ